MKNTLFALAFLLMGSFGYANLNLSEERSLDNTKESSITYKTISTTYFWTCTVYHKVIYDGEIIYEFETEEEDGNPMCYGVVFHILKKCCD